MTTPTETPTVTVDELEAITEGAVECAHGHCAAPATHVLQLRKCRHQALAGCLPHVEAARVKVERLLADSSVLSFCDVCMDVARPGDLVIRPI